MAPKPTYEELEKTVDDYENIEQQLTLLSLAVEQSSEGIAVVDLDGNLKYLNNAFAQMHGYTVEELAGKNLSVFHTIEQLPSVKAANLEIKQTGRFKGEIWHVKQDSTVFPTLMHNSLIRDDEGNPIGLMGTLRDITDIKQSEEALVGLNKTLDKKIEERTSELKRLNEHLVDSEERERNNLASYLHDNVAQSLALSVSKTKDMKESASIKDFENLSVIQEHLEQAIREIRLLIYQLCPPVLKDFDIDMAIGFLIEENNEKYQADILYINHFDEPVDIGEQKKITLYRVVNELIINIIKHSGVKEAKIELSKNKNSILLSVEDKGAGFDADSIHKEFFGGFGLYGLSQRCKNIGGNIKIQSTPGKGTKAELCIPINF